MFIRLAVKGVSYDAHAPSARVRSNVYEARSQTHKPPPLCTQPNLAYSILESSGGVSPRGIDRITEASGWVLEYLSIPHPNPLVRLVPGGILRTQQAVVDISTSQMATHSPEARDATSNPATGYASRVHRCQ